MARSITSPSAGNTILDKLKAYEGGTGFNTASAALAAMNGIPLASVNQPGGVVGLDSNKKISPLVLPVNSLSIISLNGDLQVVKGTTSIFKITNFDNFTSYEIGAVSGIAVLVGDTVSYTAPTVIGASGFTINGRLLDIQVVDFKPLTPKLSVVDSIGPDSASAILQANGDPFNTGGGTSTHLNSDWQVSTDPAFNNVVLSSMADPTNKTSWTTSALLINTTYYIRVRYRDSNNGVSYWSETSTLTTRSLYYPAREEMKLSPSDRSAVDQFGRALAFSGDGNRVVAGSYNVGTNKKGSVYVYLRNGSNWNLEAKFPAASVDTGSSNQGLYRGMWLATDATGVRVVVGVAFSNKAMVYRRDGVTWTLETEITVPGGNVQVSVELSKDSTRLVLGEITANRSHVYLRTGTTWALEASLQSADSLAPGFGYKASFDDTATRLAVSAVYANSETNSSTSVGAVFIYLRNGTTWTKEVKLSGTAIDQVTNTYFGSDIKFSSSGDCLAIGCSGGTTTATNTGCLYVFRRSGVIWTQEARKSTPAIATGYALGYSVSMNGVGNLIAVTAPLQGTGGYVHLFTRTGSAWDITATFTSSDIKSNDQFGNEVALASNSSRLAVSAHGSDSGSVNDSGGVYIFS